MFHPMSFLGVKMAGISPLICIAYSLFLMINIVEYSIEEVGQCQRAEYAGRIPVPSSVYNL
jgi:hypothetical protein